MKLYGMAQSRSFRALWALEETGIPYDYVPIKLMTAAAESDSAQNPEYLALNTQGKVPTLVDGDFILTESAAIVNYIGRKAPASGLVPAGDAAECARYDEMMYFILAELEQPLWSNGKHRFALPEAQRIPQMLETAQFEFAKTVSTLDHLLEDREYAIGNRFTMADLLIAHTFNWAIRFKFTVPEHYVALRDRHYQRAAAVRAMQVIS